MVFILSTSLDSLARFVNKSRFNVVLKEGLAIAYNNLGILAETRGELRQVERYYQDRVALIKEVRASENIKQV